MARKVSPAQRANQMTFLLKGYLKNVQHDGMESYAQERLGLRRAALYRYLQIYDGSASHTPRGSRSIRRGSSRSSPTRTRAFMKSSRAKCVHACSVVGIQLAYGASSPRSVTHPSRWKPQASGRLIAARRTVLRL